MSDHDNPDTPEVQRGRRIARLASRWLQSDSQMLDEELYRQIESALEAGMEDALSTALEQLIAQEDEAFGPLQDIIHDLSTRTVLASPPTSDWPHETYAYSLLLAGVAIDKQQWAEARLDAPLFEGVIRQAMNIEDADELYLEVIPEMLHVLTIASMRPTDCRRLLDELARSSITRENPPGLTSLHNSNAATDLVAAPADYGDMALRFIPVLSATRLGSRNGIDNAKTQQLERMALLCEQSSWQGRSLSPVFFGDFVSCFHFSATRFEMLRFELECERLMAAAPHALWAYPDATDKQWDEKHPTQLRTVFKSGDEIQGIITYHLMPWDDFAEILLKIQNVLRGYHIGLAPRQ